jgi:methyltransferase (TIGR00027 family)
LDTRAYRLARRSDIPVFEVDLPINIARKKLAVQRALGALPTSVRLVPLDFERDDLVGALTEHGYPTKARTFFVWEGVTQYLTEDAVKTTIGALEGTAPGSRLVFTYVRKDFVDGVNMYGAALLYKRFRQRQQVWKFGMRPEAVADFLDGFGWRMIEQAGPEYMLEHYIRPAQRDIAASELEWSVYAEKL